MGTSLKVIELTLISKSVEDTVNIGKTIGENLKAGDVVALIGELGAGKTCITQGIAKGVGVPDKYYVTSPTFTLINEYPGRIPFYHFDVYRLSGSENLEEDLGCREYFYGKGVSVIEWAEKIESMLPSNTLFVYLQYMDGDKRKIKISGKCDSISTIIKKLEEGGFS